MENNSNPVVGVAKPIHIRRLNQALDVSSFLDYANYNLNEPINDEPVSDLEENDDEEETDHEETKIDRSVYFNLTNIGQDRQWLRDILLADSEDDEAGSSNMVTEDDLRQMLREHVREKKYRKRYHKNPSKYERYRYYGTSFLSYIDMYTENQKNDTGKKKKEKEREVKVPVKKISKRSQPVNKIQVQEDIHVESATEDPEWLDNLSSMKDDEDYDLIINQSVKSSRANKKKWTAPSPEVMTQRRRKLWVLMAKKEMGKIQRAKANNHKEQLQASKRTAQICMKYCRQKAMQSQKNMKETVWRCKRLTREMQGYWKRYDRVERETRRRMEKEAEEQRKMDVELIEAKRQQRKLNYLITQTELYAHFMSGKLGKATPEEQLRILNQLDEEKNPRLANIDDYDCEAVKAKVQKNVQEAFDTERARTRQFDSQIQFDLSDSKTNIEEEHPQPSIFKGNLKGYQLKGMNWLANLYDQGISGILADEMGLGKTVQSIAFLCHVAEKYSVWGPFLVISPASTLHNWQQEMARFVPSFRVVPYWGNPTERKILRQFWEQKDLHTKDASFHVVITSYQIIIADIKYFNRIKWQYMILDEAQAIKSSSSVRWKMLLGFSCRNRLLLSGTPIQNSMAELWALLHFIMPTLFDSHDEFNEWFSKDIESHAENKTNIDQKHLSRLHMILKPFMLRRIKKDVENELSDKIEVMMYCPLTTRQKLLYMALKKKIRIEDLLHFTVGGDAHSVDKNFTSNLMNLVMQFRKVCNHPELFERRDAKSPFYLQCPELVVPKLLYDDFSACSKVTTLPHLLLNKFNIWMTEYIHRYSTCFTFRFLMNLSPKEMYETFMLGMYVQWCNYESNENIHFVQNHRKFWDERGTNVTKDLFYLNSKSRELNFHPSETIWSVLLTSVSETHNRFYTHTRHVIKTSRHDLETEDAVILPKKKFECQPTDLPMFLTAYCPRAQSRSRKMYCISSRAVIQNIQTTLACQEAWRVPKETSVLPSPPCGLDATIPSRGWFNIMVPDKETLVTDAGKLAVLDGLLKKLKLEGHRVLIYSQMTKMIDLLEEYMWHRKHKYMRLDGSSKISERRDMVADFQARTDIFVFLLSTRAGGLGINLTAADTVIFYDSDWNPTVDQQAMDRAHRLGQTKQVTVYRLICKGSIEERILQRAREKSEIQRMVISGGNFKPDTLKPKEVVSLLLDDEEIETKYRQKAEERKYIEESREKKERDRKRKQFIASNPYIIDDMMEEYNVNPKRVKYTEVISSQDSGYMENTSLSVSPTPSDENAGNDTSSMQPQLVVQDDSSNDGVIDVERNVPTPLSFSLPYGSRQRIPVRGTSRRGRPRGSRRGGGTGSKGRDGTEEVQTVTFSETSTESTPVRRGPGRPRLKPGGPSNQGVRGVSRPRKPVGSLPVPLRSQAMGGGPAGAVPTPPSFKFYQSHDSLV